MREKTANILTTLYVIWFLLSFISYTATFKLLSLTDTITIVTSIFASESNFALLIIVGGFLYFFASEKTKYVIILIPLLIALLTIIEGLKMYTEGTLDYHTIIKLCIGFFGIILFILTFGHEYALQKIKK